MVGVGFFPLILRPTRVSHANVTLIYHIWSNFADNNVASGVVQFDLNDNYVLFENFPSNSVSEKIFRRHHTTKAHALNWNSLCDINNENSCYDELMHKIYPYS